MSVRIRRATRPAAAGAVLALLLTACTGSEEPEPVTRTTVPPPVVNEPSEEPSLAPGPEESGDPGVGGEETPSDDASAEQPTAEETDPAALPPFDAAGTPQLVEPSGELLLPVSVRVGDHEGFDRVVVELDGDGTPGWQTEYVARAIEDGRGAEVDVDGEAILSVFLTGTRYPEEGEDYPSRHVVDGEDVVEEVHFLGTFEGMTQLFIGVDDGLADYRVFTLADPARLVIDIEDLDD